MKGRGGGIAPMLLGGIDAPGADSV